MAAKAEEKFGLPVLMMGQLRMRQREVRWVESEGKDTRTLVEEMVGIWGGRRYLWRLQWLMGCVLGIKQGQLIGLVDCYDVFTKIFCKSYRADIRVIVVIRY